MGWSRAQQIMLHRAASAADWNDRQRYMAMRHAGCPIDRAKQRPSITHPRNTQRQFELTMSIAEGHAWMHEADLEDFPRPRWGDTWAARAGASNGRLDRKIRAIWAEAADRLPETFDRAGLDGFVQRMTKDHDESLAFQPRPRSLEHVADPATLDKILEGLKAWAGREFLKRDMRPATFDPPPRERARLGLA